MIEKQLEDLLKDGKQLLKPKHKNVLRDALLEQQNHLCKVCEKPLKDEWKGDRVRDLYEIELFKAFKAAAAKGGAIPTLYKNPGAKYFRF